MADDDTKPVADTVEAAVVSALSVEPTEPAAEASPPAAAEASPPAPAAEPPKPPAEDWRVARIAKLTAQLRETQEKLQAAQQAASATPAEGFLPKAEVDRLAAEKATEIAATAKFNAECDAAAALGKKEFPDFEARIADLRKLVSPGDPASQQAQVALIQAALQTGEAHRVLHRLGGDLNEASRVMSLPPMAMAVEVAKLALSPPPAPPLPKPIVPVGSRGAAHVDISPDDPERGESLSIGEWMRRREAQAQERFKQRGR